MPVHGNRPRTAGASRVLLYLRSTSARMVGMQPLNDKKILLGVTGGIAAYKAAELVRLLIKAGAEVRVVMPIDTLIQVRSKAPVAPDISSPTDPPFVK